MTGPLLEVTCPECGAALAVLHKEGDEVLVEVAEGMRARRSKGLVSLVRPMRPGERRSVGRLEAFNSIRFEHCDGPWNVLKAGYNGRGFDA